MTSKRCLIRRLAAFLAVSAAFAGPPPVPAFAATSLYADLDPGSPGSSPKDGLLHAGDLWFQADKILYRFNGTTLTPEKDFSADLQSSKDYVIYDGDIYMQGVGLSPATGAEVFRYDLATGNVELAIELVSGSLGSLPEHFVVNAGFLYFAATNSDTELYRSDGTTVTEIDVWPGASSSAPYDLTVFDGDLFFIAGNASTGYQTLYRLDGLTPTAISPEIQSGAELIVWNGGLYMTGTENTGGGQTNVGALWKYNGTSLVFEVDIDPTNFQTLPIRNLHAHTDGNLYFRGNDGTTGQELWKYDGSGATVVQDFFPGTAGLIPLELCSVNGRVVFQGRSGNDTELYGSDGTTVFLLEDIRPGTTGSAPKCLTGDREGSSFGGWAYYQANDGTSGVELWRTDGFVAAVAAPVTSATAVRLSSPAPNPFRHGTRLNLSLTRAEHLDVAVFDSAGRRVVTLHRGDLPAGWHTFRWAGARAASGTYFIRAQGERGTESRRVVRLR